MLLYVRFPPAVVVAAFSDFNAPDVDPPAAVFRVCLFTPIACGSMAVSCTSFLTLLLLLPPLPADLTTLMVSSTVQNGMTKFIQRM